MGLNFHLELDCQKSSIMKIFCDFEYYPNYFSQIENVKIIEKNKNEIMTEEILVFKTYLKNKITQKTKHEVISNSEINSIIIEGPASGSKIKIIFKEIENKTLIIIDIDLKLSLKAKIFQPIINKAYKQFMTGLLIKMNNRCKGDF